MSDSDRISDDELLSKLIDRELTGPEARELHHRLANEPALAARLEALKQTNATVRDAYASIADEPLPKRLIELLGASGDAEHDKVVRLPRRKRMSIFTIPMATAASIALLAGTVLGLFVARIAPAPQRTDWTAAAGIVEPRTELYELLQSAPSTETRELATGESATPRLTFRSVNGPYCRQVDLQGTRRSAEMLACRDNDAWRLEVVAFGAPSAMQPESVYRPAAGASTPVGSAIDELIAGAPLDAEAERALIAREWEVRAR